jgi:hypothetical protein
VGNEKLNVQLLEDHMGSSYLLMDRRVEGDYKRDADLEESGGHWSVEAGGDSC